MAADPQPWFDQKKLNARVGEGETRNISLPPALPLAPNPVPNRYLYLTLSLHVELRAKPALRVMEKKLAIIPVRWP